MRQIIPFACGVAALLWLSAAAVGAPSEVNVVQLDGSQVQGELTAWTADQLTLSVDGRSTTLTTAELLALEWSEADAPAESPEALVELLDGTRLPIERYAVTGNHATVETPLAREPLKILTEQIRAVQFTRRAMEEIALWRKQNEKQLAGDLLVVMKKRSDRVDYLTGVVGDVSEKSVDFDWEGEQIPVRRGKVAAVVYYHGHDVPSPEPKCWLLTTGGARLPLAAGELVGQGLHATTTTDLELQIPLASLRQVDYSVGKLTYLSDLTPLRQKWTPRIGLPKSAAIIAGYGLPRRDQSFSGSTLSLAWPPESGMGNNVEVVTYKKGLALRSRTELLYRLRGDMQRLVALAGIDPLTASEGSVELSIFADDQEIWQAEIEGGAPPTEIDVELGGARQLRILVDYGANLDFGDRLHLAEARVTK